MPCNSSSNPLAGIRWRFSQGVSLMKLTVSGERTLNFSVASKNSAAPGVDSSTASPIRYRLEFA